MNDKIEDVMAAANIGTEDQRGSKAGNLHDEI
jgi:hypothetical protein